MAVLFLNAAYVALLSSTFTRSLHWIRVALVCGSIFFISYAIAEDIPSMLVWNICIGGMHLVRLLRDTKARRSISLTVEEASVRDTYFEGLSDFDFGILWGIGRPVQFQDEQLIAKGTTPDFVMLVLGGQVAIEHEGAVSRGVGRGGFVGEMSFISGQPANVDVHARGLVVGHCWSQSQLTALEQLNAPSARAFRENIERDLVAKARVTN